MHALRPFEDVLMDVYDNERESNRLADMLVEYELEELRLMCAAGVDAVQFGDDFGTARATVSYTHLDVYKRQAVNDVIKGLFGAVPASEDRFNLYFNDVTNFDRRFSIRVKSRCV